MISAQAENSRALHAQLQPLEFTLEFWLNIDWEFTLVHSAELQAAATAAGIPSGAVGELDLDLEEEITLRQHRYSRGRLTPNRVSVSRLRKIIGARAGLP